MKLSIVIPVYNEKRTVKAVVERVLKLPLDKELVLVDDGSSDGSGEILDKELAGLPGVRVFHQVPNQGKGAALRRGFREAAGEVVIVQDADLELEPEDIVHVAGPVLRGEAEVVYGSRFLEAPARPASLSWWANKFLTALTNVLYGARVTDMETCYKCFRKDVLGRFRIEADRFDFEPEITAKLLRLGYRIREVPIRYVPRTAAQGKKIGWKDGAHAVWTLIKHRFRRLPPAPGA